MQARALVVEAKDTVAVRPVTIREPGPEEVLLETVVTCVSPGTELRTMRGLAEGTVFPYIPGYANIGRVVAKGAKAEIAIGTLCLASGTRHAEGLALTWGGHCSHAVIEERALLPVPAGVDPLDAVMVRLGAISYHGMRVSDPRPGERVAVLGLGPIGQLAALMHRLAGARVVGYDRAEARMATARAAGIETTAAAATPAAAFAQVFPGGADIVVDATGSIHAIPGGIEVAKMIPWGTEVERGARYLIQGSYPASFSIPYQPAFFKELSFLLPRDASRGDHQAVMACLARRELSLRAMVTTVLKPEQAADAYRMLAEDPTQVTVAFRWSG
jgi:2-desacetyl-2-hydroxyethyl bacteriochlorophyllide A dehydrogenase